ncbi:MAG: glycosyltransferase [Candidatus Margulisiibacteriota bacterium]
MKKLKIMQVIQFFSPEMGGSVGNVFGLSKTLVKMGHEVTICTTDFAFDEGYAKELKGVQVKKFASKYGKYRYTPEMKDWLEQETKNYDVLHLNNYWGYQNMVSSAAATKAGVPYVVSPHGSIPIIMNGFIKKYLFDLVFGARILRNASRVVGVSDLEKRQIASKGVSDNKIVTISNAVILPPEGIKDGQEFRKRYGIPENKKILLYLGRLHKRKGVDILIKAFSKLLADKYNAVLVITGPDDGFEKEAHALIKGLGIEKDVLLTGPLYGRDKYLAYYAADIYVLNSSYEIFGNTILEACSCGTPVVINDKGGIAGVVAGNCGEVAKYDYEDLAKKIKVLLDSPQKRASYGEMGYKMVRENFTWDKIAKLYESVYIEVTSSKSPV